MNFKKTTNGLPLSGNKYQLFKGDTDYKVSEPKSKSGKAKGKGKAKQEETAAAKPGSSPTIVNVEDENQYGEGLQPTDVEETIEKVASESKRAGKKAADLLIQSSPAYNLIKSVGDFLSEDTPQESAQPDDYGASFEYGIEPNPIQSVISELE